LAVVAAARPRPSRRAAPRARRRSAPARPARCASSPRPRGIGGAIAPLRGNVRRIGFHHDRILSERAADAADPQGALERHRAAEAEAKAELDEGAGLLFAAVEGVGEAARDRSSTQVLEDGVDGAAHVQQHRQAELGRELELGGEHRRLAVAIEAFDEMVEADLADRDQARVAGVTRERVAQRVEVARAGAIGAHRMDAERVGEPMPVRELAHALEVAGVDRRDHDLGDSRAPRPGDDGVAIGVELGGVEVAMRVDPHAAMMPARRRRPAL
jgi:hypothetical protein